jgi:ribosomal protein L35
MASKTNKSARKRFKITKSGKVLYRPRPQNHFRAKQTSTTKQAARSHEELDATFSRQIKKEYLPFHG